MQGLVATIKRSNKRFLSCNNLIKKDIEIILTKCMITSEDSLLKVEHVIALAGLKEINEQYAL